MITTVYQPGRDFALSLDSADELKGFRQEFAIPDPDLIYMDGNSLGRLPRKTSEHFDHLINEEWGNRLIRSWGEGWFDAPLRIGDKIASLVGAAPGQVA